MAFYPVRTPRIQGPDIGAAIQQGQGNALRSLQLREGIREVQGRNILDTLSKRTDLTDAQKIETLNQSGRSDMAEKFKADQMRKAQYAMEGIKRGAMFVNDEESFNHWMQTSIDAGYSKPEKWIENIGDSYEKARPVLSKLRGEKETTSKSVSAKKRDELIANGLDPNLAEGIAYGTMTTEVNPQTGDIVIVDKRKYGKGTVGERQDVLIEGNVQQKELDKKVERFSKEIEKSGVGGTESVLADIESKITEIRKDDKNADIPGFGATAKLPDFMLTEKGKQLRQRVATLFNTVLKDRSGAAVTSQELTRLKNEFGQGLIKTDDQLLDALDRFRNVLDEHKLTLAAGYDDDVVSTWQSRSNLTLRDIKEGDGGDGKKTVVRRYAINPQTGKLEAK